MTNVAYFIEEKVCNHYQLIVNECNLKKLGYGNVSDYLKKYDNNAWAAENSDDGVIEEIVFNQLIDYVSSDFDTAEIDE